MLQAALFFFFPFFGNRDQLPRNAGSEGRVGNRSLIVALCEPMIKIAPAGLQR